MLTIPGHEYEGGHVEGNGARGRARASYDPGIIWFCLHTYEGGTENMPVDRLLANVRTPASPANRSFQSRDLSGRLQWEGADGKRTTDPAKAIPATVGGQVFRPPDPPLAVVKGVTPMPWCYGSAYDAFADADQGDGGYRLTVDPTLWILNAQGGAEPNARTVSICLPGRSSRTREQWLTGRSRRMIRGAARFFVDVSTALGTIPNHRCTVADLVARRGGYCGHVDFSHAFRKSDHGDPGPNFPWDVFAADILEILQGDDMAQLVAIEGEVAAFAINGGVARWIPSWDALLQWQADKTLASGWPQVWPVTRLSTYLLAGEAPGEKHPDISKITAANFAGHLLSAA